MTAEPLPRIVRLLPGRFRCDPNAPGTKENTAAALLLAGIYQFTPLKYHCLDKCRSPFSFITEHWRGRSERAQAFLLGIHHGRFCLGC